MHSIQKPLRLRRVNHSDEIIAGLGRLLKSESMADVTLICSGGQTIRAHRVILSTFSPYFRAIFESQPFSNNPCQYPVIVIKDLGLAELRAIVEFIYRGETSVPREKLAIVLQAARELEISGLADFKNDSSINGHSNGNSDLNDLVTITSAYGNHSSAALAAAAASSNWKRSHESLDNQGSSLFSENLKKSRITLESGAEAIGISILGDSGLNTSGGDNVRSLLHQPNRISQGLQSLRGLNQGLNLNKNR